MFNSKRAYEKQNSKSKSAVTILPIINFAVSENY